MSKPKFNPNQPFQETKPKFDPNAEFQMANESPDIEVQLTEGSSSSPATSSSSSYDPTTRTTTVVPKEKSGLQKFADGLNAFNAGFEQMMPFRGVTDRVGAGMEAAVTDKTYDESFKSIRDDRGQRFDQNPTAGVVGNVAGFGSNFVIPAGGVKSAMTMGAIEGGTGGDELSPIGAAIGAGGAWAFPKVLSKADEVRQWLGKKLSKTAQESAIDAVGAIQKDRSRLSESQRERIGQTLLDSEVVTPFASNKTMASRAKGLQDEGGKLMGEVYDTIDATGPSFDPMEAAKRMQAKIPDMPELKTNRAERQVFNTILEDIKSMSPAYKAQKQAATLGQDAPTVVVPDKISLREAQQLKQTFQKIAFPGGKKPIPGNESPKQLAARDAYNVIGEYIDEIALKAGGETGEAMARGKADYESGKQASRLLKMKDDRGKGNKKIGLTDAIWGSSAAAGGLATGDPVSAGAVALTTIGVKKLAEAYGSQWTATTANKLAKALQNPTYAKLFETASQRGPGAIAVLHRTLMKNDPEYQNQWNADEQP